MSKKKKTIEELLEKAIVSKEEQSYEIPENWICVRTEYLGEVVTGSTPSKKKEEYYGGKFPFIKPGDLTQENNIIEANEYLSEEGKKVARLIPPGSTLICCIGSIGKAGFTAVECTTNQQINSLIPNVLLVAPKFVYYQILSTNYQYELINRSSATTVSIINKSKVSEIPFLLPPLSEQKRIAEKVERLLEKVEEAKTLIEEAKETFELRRAAILDKAFRGELTKGWRDEKYQHSSEVLVQEEVSENTPFSIPLGWEWKKLSDIGVLERGRSKHRPRNDPKLFGGKYPFIQTGDVARAKGYVEEYSQTLSDFGFEQSKLFPVNTVCITIAANIADTSILKFPCCFPDSVVGFTPKEAYVSSEYVHYYISTIKSDLEHYAPATAQKNINLKILKEVLIPVPPKEEHDLLIEKINILLNCEEQSNQCLVLENTIDNLKKSILLKAFRGELGTNDPTEESAIELLKEVLQEKIK
ncbi:TPA: restriction endonuclease subunit S [Bacillus paranthracis]|uniref:restriction endonuclease subunit S n=1 Tax=Bacillus cereus group TaxID=86661 RepID=UPI0022E7FF46|nr:restriction endonuclease subunit S [Bacillus cereus group sp. TH40LC]MDA1514553.1 restriction endonuclease subunit S [Bacillus cereus group sp. TH40LC]